MERSTNPLWRGRAVALAFAGVLALSSCAGSGGVGAAAGGAGGVGGDGFKYGADTEKVQETLADMEPVTLVYQLASSPDSSQGRHAAAAAKRIEERSGGKVTLELAYAYSVVPQAEADKGLVDGRIDLTLVSTVAMPAKFPMGGALLSEVWATGSGEPVVGPLSMYGAVNEALWQTPEFIREAEDKGLSLLMPMGATAHHVMACDEQLGTTSDIAGAQVRNGTVAQRGQVEAIGASPVSIAYPEIYESLQRGIVDCIIFTAASLDNSGFLDLVPHLMTPVGTSFAGAPSPLYAGVDYQRMPLAARQLVYDEIVMSEIKKIFDDNTAQLLATANKAKDFGGGFFEFDENANTAIREHNGEMLSAWKTKYDFDAVAMRERLDAGYEKWEAILRESNYPTGEWEKFQDWYDDPDPVPFVDAFVQNVLIPNRPS